MNSKQKAGQDQIGRRLAQTKVLTRAKLRDALAVNNHRLGQVLESLEHAGQLRRTPNGWQRSD